MYELIFHLQEKVFKALAHSRRLEIVNLLRTDELSVQQIYEMLDLPQANVSQHLMILRDAKVLSTRKKGKQVFYSVSDLLVVEAVDLLREFLIKTNSSEDVTEELKLSMNELTPVTHDPVCQMRVSPKTAGFTYTHQEEDYYFCASGCLKVFKDNPGKYVASS